MSYRVTPQGDVNRLPKWAQSYITGLEREIENQDEHIKTISSEHPGSNVVADNYTGRPSVTLPPDSRIRFYMGETREGFHDMIEVSHARRDGKLLEIRGAGGSLAIYAHASNVVYAGMTDY